MAIDNQGSILISGAGPTGLALAIALRKNGVPVRIISKAIEPQHGQRGSGVSPRTLELHTILGTAPKILEVAVPIPPAHAYDPQDGTTIIKNFSLMPSREPTPHIPLNNYFMIGQNYHEAILREYLEELGTVVEHGTELQSFTQTGDGVQVTLVNHANGGSTETVKVPWLVGADGAHSVVRKGLGLEFLGETKSENKILICDIKVEGTREVGLTCYGGSGADALTSIVLSRPSGQKDNILWLAFMGHGIDAESMVNSREKTIETFYEISKRRDIKFGDLVASAIYCPNIRMVKKMRVDRVFVLGDAAHCHSPTGGQGLNSSIQDSINLGWKLAMAYHGSGSLKLLDSFDEERLPVIAAMLNKTTDLLETNIRSEEGITAQRSTDFLQLGVNYRNSSIILSDKSEKENARWLAYNPESETAALPGDRAPDAPSLIDVNTGAKTNIFSILSPSMHTILLFGAPSNSYDDILDTLKQLPSGLAQTVRIHPQGVDGSNLNAVDGVTFQVTVRDEGGYAAAGYNVEDSHKTWAVIIRPDGIVGARVGSGEGITDYFKLVLA
ncbi:hypothetical protein CVT24_012113 [Panaeolus cyanescens]|uniref:FAD-binding domain-containing protein n=1 Tax=Panaeolus cyanescens TaxID=181874 RepID=A0A409VHI6_9AGAR|nr:hypothetical protein CVT24_012113 [Panaeolus cyanescens]